MFIRDPVPSYNDNEFPAYMHSEEELRVFLKAMSKGKTLFACVTGFSRSGYLKKQAQEADIDVAAPSQPIMAVELLVALNPKRPNYSLDGSKVNIPGIGDFESVILACNEAEEKDTAHDVQRLLAEKNIPVSIVYMSERDIPLSF